MDTEVDTLNDSELVARLRRLDAGDVASAPAFDYQGLLERRAARERRTRRRGALARGAALAVVVVLVAASVWRLEDPRAHVPVTETTVAERPAEPRIVRADTWLAVAALEDHIASLDEAINAARVYAPRSEEVARLERTRAELLDSYAQVRYAELVSANF